MIVGLSGGFTFFALLASFAFTYLVLTLVDRSADAKIKVKADTKKMDSVSKKNFNFLASRVMLNLLFH